MRYLIRDLAVSDREFTYDSTLVASKAATVSCLSVLLHIDMDLKCTTLSVCVSWFLSGIVKANPSLI